MISAEAASSPDVIFSPPCGCCEGTQPGQTLRITLRKVSSTEMGLLMQGVVRYFHLLGLESLAREPFGLL